jgi:hypothetical protein
MCTVILAFVEDAWKWYGARWVVPDGWTRCITRIVYDQPRKVTFL